MSAVIAFLQTHSVLAYPVLFLGSYADTFIGIGFFIYGEIFFIAGSVLAGAGVLDIWLVALALYLGGILGDTSSYFIGLKYGAGVILAISQFLIIGYAFGANWQYILSVIQYDMWLVFWVFVIVISLYFVVRKFFKNKNQF